MLRGVIGRVKAAEWHRKERIEREKHYRSMGAMNVGKLSQREIFLIGLSLYWAEGAKTYRRILFANSDPAMVKLFIACLETSFGINKKRLTFRIQINYNHLSRIDQIETYWVKLLEVDRSQFTKANIIRVQAKKSYPDPEKYFGLINVVVKRGTNLSYQIMGAIDRLREIA